MSELSFPPVDCADEDIPAWLLCDRCETSDEAFCCAHRYGAGHAKFRIWWTARVEALGWPVAMTGNTSAGRPAELDGDKPGPLNPKLSVHWRQTAERLIEMCAPKVEEYGSRDLIEIGRSMMDLAEPGGYAVTDAFLFEVGALFYVQGKLARWHNAIRSRRPVARDTIDDIITYCHMVLHNRHAEGTEQ